MQDINDLFKWMLQNTLLELFKSERYQGIK